MIYEGVARKPIGPPPFEPDRAAWYRDYVARRFLPYYLAAFFLFDGEQVRQFASRDMETQVRRGIEGLLGLPVLKALGEDLRRYATSQQGSVVKTSDQTVATIQAEIARLEDDEARAAQRVDEIAPLLERLEAERDALTREIGGYGSGSQALLEELIREEQRYRTAVETALEKLQTLLAGDLALALAGTSLRQATIEQLAREEVREKWEAGREQGHRGLDRFVEALDAALTGVYPSLMQEQRAAVIDRVKSCWDSLWHPPPADCAEFYRHGYLRGPERMQARERLDRSAQLSAIELTGLLREVAESVATADRLQSERLAKQSIAPELEEKEAKLRDLMRQITDLSSEKKMLERDLTVTHADLATKRQEFGRLVERQREGAEPLRRARLAVAYADMIDELVRDAVPSQVGAVAQAMTDAFKSMARKKDMVARIEIEPDCTVRLLSRLGTDLRDRDLSAGEQQIFTQSLIWAIARISQREFPFVVDTPLGRLDEEHREGVLRHFTDRPGQVILLSTDTEIVGRYLDIIRPRILRTYRMRHEIVGDVGVSRPEPGYFE